MAKEAKDGKPNSSHPQPVKPTPPRPINEEKPKSGGDGKEIKES